MIGKGKITNYNKRCLLNLFCIQLITFYENTFTSTMIIKFIF